MLTFPTSFLTAFDWWTNKMTASQLLLEWENDEALILNSYQACFKSIVPSTIAYKYWTWKVTAKYYYCMAAKRRSPPSGHYTGKKDEIFSGTDEVLTIYDRKPQSAWKLSLTSSIGPWKSWMENGQANHDLARNSGRSQKLFQKDFFWSIKVLKAFRQALAL